MSRPPQQKTVDSGLPLVIRRTVGEVAEPSHGHDLPVETVYLSAGSLDIEVCTFGATLRRFGVVDETGNSRNLLRGPECWTELQAGHRNDFMGSSVGPVAGRIANATYRRGGDSIHLIANDGSHTLHGGDPSFAHLPWTVAHCETGADFAAVTLGLDRPCGAGGFPGEMHVTATFSVDRDGLTITYQAASGDETPISMTNHGYFSLSDEPTIEQHTLQVLASAVLRTDSDLVATGEIEGVQGAPYDFRWQTMLNRRLGSFVFATAGGIDHSFVVDYPLIDGPPVAVLTHPATGRRLQIRSDQPTVHVYTANHVGTSAATENVTAPDATNGLGPHCGICFETQQPANAVNIEVYTGEDGATLRPEIWLRPGSLYKATTRFEFDIVPPSHSMSSE